MGAVNHEYGPGEYRVESKADYTIGALNPIALDHEGKFDKPVKFSLLEPGQNIKVEFLLYRKGDGDPYRSLHLPITYYLCQQNHGMLFCQRFQPGNSGHQVSGV